MKTIPGTNETYKDIREDWAKWRDSWRRATIEQEFIISRGKKRMTGNIYRLYMHGCVADYAYLRGWLEL